MGWRGKKYKQNKNGGKDIDFARTVFIKNPQREKMKN